MRALNDVVESGKVRYLGASSVSDFFHLTYPRRRINAFWDRWLLGSSKP
jgi:hypothetical protein